MKILHCVVDDKFLDGAISLFGTDKRVDNDWCFFTEDSQYTFSYIKNPIVRIMPLSSFCSVVVNYDVVILHSLPSLPVDKILSVPQPIKVVWFLFGHEMYDGTYPLVPFDLYLDYTKQIKEELYGKFTIWKRCKRAIKKLIYKGPYYHVLKRIDYFSGVFEYEYGLLKERYPHFHAKQLDFYYGSTDFFIKDKLSTDITNQMRNVIIGNSGNMINNHVDAIEYLCQNANLDLIDKVIMPLSYGGGIPYVSKVKQYALDLLGNKACILDNYLPANEYWELVSNCKIAIYALARQSASDNVLYQLMNGAKVYMTNRSAAFHYLKGLGIYLYTLEDDMQSINEELTEEQILKNREIIVKKFSARTLIQRVHSIIDILIWDNKDAKR